MNYFFLQLKREAKGLLRALMLTLLLMAAVGIGLFVAAGIDASREANQQVRVGIVGRGDDELLSFAFALIESADTVRFSMDFVDCDDEQAAKDLLEGGKIAAYLLIPEGFAESVLYAENMCFDYVTLRSNESVGSVLTREVLEAVSAYIAGIQAGSLAVEDYALSLGRSGREASALNNAATLAYLGLAGRRGELAELREIGLGSELSGGGYYLCAMCLLFLLLWGVSRIPALLKDDLALNKLLHARGRGAGRQIAAEFAAFALLTAIAFALLVAAVGILSNYVELPVTELRYYIASDFVQLFTGSLAAVFCLAALAFAIAETVRKTVPAAVIGFLTAALLAFFGGLFYPLHFFPIEVQNAMQYLPTGAAFDVIAAALHGEAAVEADLLCLLYGSVFLAAAIAARSLRIKGKRAFSCGCVRDFIPDRAKVEALSGNGRQAAEPLSENGRQAVGGKANAAALSCGRWFAVNLLLQSKRLYKSPAFLLILLCFLAVAALGGNLLAETPSVMRAAFVNYEGTLAESQVERLINDESIVTYLAVGEAEAYELLRHGKVDSVWDLGSDFDAGLAGFIGYEEQKGSSGGLLAESFGGLSAANGHGRAPIRVTVRESSVFFSLASERIFAELFPMLSREFFAKFVEDNFGEGHEAAEFYEKRLQAADLMNYRYLDSEAAVTDSFLLMPLRGIFALILVLAALAAVMNFLAEAEAGKYAALSASRRSAAAFACALAGGGNIALFMLPTLAICGLWTVWWQEIPAIMLYILAAGSFAAVCGKLLRRADNLCAAMPIIIVILLIFSPVFIDLGLPILAYPLPTHYYLQGVFDAKVLLGGVIYTAVGCGLLFAGKGRR